MGRPRRRARPDRQRAARAPDRLGRRASGPRRGIRDVDPGSPRRPLDGPVQRDGRRRRRCARRRRAARPRARPPDAGVCRRRGDGRRSSACDEAREPELVAAGQALGVFTIANRNSPGQIVVSGERAAVEGAAEEAARELGAKRAIVLPVSVAAHSPLMSPPRPRRCARSSPTSSSPIPRVRCWPTPTRDC